MARAPSIPKKLIMRNKKGGHDQGHSDGDGRIPGSAKDQNGEDKAGRYGDKAGGKPTPGFGKSPGATGPASARKSELPYVPDEAPFDRDEDDVDQDGNPWPKGKDRHPGNLPPYGPPSDEDVLFSKPGSRRRIASKKSVSAKLKGRTVGVG